VMAVPFGMNRRRGTGDSLLREAGLESGVDCWGRIGHAGHVLRRSERRARGRAEPDLATIAWASWTASGPVFPRHPVLQGHLHLVIRPGDCSSQSFWSCWGLLANAWGHGRAGGLRPTVVGGVPRRIGAIILPGHLGLLQQKTGGVTVFCRAPYGKVSAAFASVSGEVEAQGLVPASGRALVGEDRPPEAASYGRFSVRAAQGPCAAGQVGRTPRSGFVADCTAVVCRWPRMGGLSDLDWDDARGGVALAFVVQSSDTRA